MAVPEWLDPLGASTGKLVGIALFLAVALVALAYGIAWLWQRFRDPRMN